MDGWTDSGHAVPLLPGTSNSPRGRSSPFPNRLEGCAQREGPLWPLVWGPPRPRWAQGQLRLLSSAAGQKLVGSLPLRVPRPPGPRCAAWGLGHVGSPGCPWGGGSQVRFWPVLPWSCVSPRELFCSAPSLLPTCSGRSPLCRISLHVQGKKALPLQLSANCVPILLSFKYTQSWSPRDWEAGLE